MTLGARVFLGAFVGVVIVFALLFRIDAKPGPTPYSVFVTNHWTGAVYLCIYNSPPCKQIYPDKP